MFSKIFLKFNYFLDSSKFSYIYKEKDLNNFFKNTLNQETIIGLDTEFLWRDTYYPQLSLIQVKTSKGIYIMDFIQLKEKNLFLNLFAREDLVIVMNSARSDSTVISTNLEIDLKNVFDVQIAEKLLGEVNQRSYSFLVKKYTSILLKKDQTNSNWLKRPLTYNQLKYAADDVEFLIYIYKEQTKKLKKINQYERALEYSMDEVRKGFQSLSLSRIQKFKKDDSLSLDIFKWRERLAEKENIPPSRIMKDKNIKKLSHYLKNRNISDGKWIFKDKKYQDLFLKEFL